MENPDEKPKIQIENDVKKEIEPLASEQSKVPQVEPENTSKPFEETTQVTPEEKDIKPKIEMKSSSEILSELFNTFQVEAPILLNEEKDPTSKRHKKKKKHKHKEKKHKKKGKKRKHDEAEDDDDDDDKSSILDFDLSKLLVKEEKQSNEKKIKIAGTDLSLSLDKVDDIEPELDIKPVIKTIEDIEPKHKRHKCKNKRKHEKKSKKEKNDFYGTKENEDFHRSKSPRSRSPRSRSPRSRSHSRGRERRWRHDDDFYRDRRHDKDDDDFYKSREARRHRRSRSRDYSWSRKHDADSSVSHIDKKRLLEIARKNAIQMMKSGSLPAALTLGPQAQEKVIAAIKSGGKTIDELTEFCKTLSRQEDLGELSDVDDDRDSGSDVDRVFNHPFQLRDRPSTITMNIKNSVPLPVKTVQERNELRMQFPVSSGQHHRVNENEWIPVPTPKKDATVPKQPQKTLESQLKESATILPLAQPVPETNPNVQTTADIAAIVSQRLTAMRKLHENPHDVQALTQMHKSTKEVQSWAESKQQPGQFTGAITGNFLSQAELSSGYQAWAKKDQLQVAAPVAGGMGMHLLQKMGWKPGEGLGKEKTGALEPLLLEVKLDKKGLVATEETKRKKRMKQQQQNLPNGGVQGKHPVSLLGEYACKNKLGAPLYELCFECGPDHKKNFVFKVSLNGLQVQPNVASPNKKEAKANAALLCLQKLGVVN